MERKEGNEKTRKVAPLHVASIDDAPTLNELAAAAQ